MGLKADEFVSGCFARAEADEPVFVLLSRDRLAALLVRAWASLRTLQIWIGLKPASDYIKVDEARELACRMTRWRKVDRFKPATVRLALASRAAPQICADGGYVGYPVDLPSLGDLIGPRVRGYGKIIDRAPGVVVITDGLIPPGSAPRAPVSLRTVGGFRAPDVLPPSATPSGGSSGRQFRR